MKIGCGGGGKTYNALSDIGFYDVCYVAPSHKLLRAKKLEFNNLTYCTLSKLTGGQDKDGKMVCLPKFNTKSPATIICDEITQYTNKQKKFIIKTYKYSKIIFCGDISKDGNIMYQLPCITGEKFSIKNINCVEEYNVNRRCKCPKLLKRLNVLRKDIENGISSNSVVRDIINTKAFNIISCKDMNYDINDYILCSKRQCNIHHREDCNCDGKNYSYYWTKKYEGKFEKGKYLMTSNSNGYCNGDVIISDKKPSGSIPRHAFSCHQIQGETIKGSKIFIDSRNLFDSSMLYTAISRAEYYEQIFIIA